MNTHSIKKIINNAGKNRRLAREYICAGNTNCGGGGGDGDGGDYPVVPTHIPHVGDFKREFGASVPTSVPIAKKKNTEGEGGCCGRA